jgi:hypothetical protein
MMLYDAPDSLSGLAQRASTVIAPQALAMLNNKQVQEHARAFARRLMGKEGSTVEQTILLGYQSALGRPPDAEELSESIAFLQRAAGYYQSAGKSDASELALADFCQVLFGLNEFIYID